MGGFFVLLKIILHLYHKRLLYSDTKNNIDKIYFLENDFLHNIYGPAEINMLNLQNIFYLFFAFFTIIIYKNTLKILPAIVAMPCALRS